MSEEDWKEKARTLGDFDEAKLWREGRAPNVGDELGEK
jgi:hypothetical protein